jgi:hypothetical protein
VSNADERGADARRYVRTVYCEPFEEEGLVHEDGALRIDVVEALAGGMECGTAEAGEEPRTIPCPPDPDVDCALLRHVRRAEVQAYLQRIGAARCDDETPLDQLGVP